MSRNFVVSPLDPDAAQRHFSSVDKAVAFAASQAKAAWSAANWSVLVVDNSKQDTDLRLIVDVVDQVELLDADGVVVGFGNISSKGKLLLNCLGWDVLDPFISNLAPFISKEN